MLYMTVLVFKLLKHLFSGKPVFVSAGFAGGRPE